jgi:predicted ABC-type ATPase
VSDKKIIIIAGPNGAGKTTFAQEFLSYEANCPIFINADLIASGLSPNRPERVAIQAGKRMLREINENVENEISFAFESTLSGKLYVRKIPQWQDLNYHIKLVYLSLSTVEMAIARVATRVQNGGHDIPEDVIRRRYSVGFENFNTIYKTIVNTWILFDNSGKVPVIIDEGKNDR